MTRPTRIPADVNRPDRILGPLTAHQATLLAVPAAMLYLAWTGLRNVLALPVFLALAAPVAAFAIAVAIGHRDGLPLDRFLLAALRHRLNPHRAPRSATPDAAGQHLETPPALSPRFPSAGGTMHPPKSATRGERRVPATLLSGAVIGRLGHDPAAAAVLDLGAAGLVAVAAVSTINLGLRSPVEQDALVAGFARYLNSLTGPVQFLVRTVALDLSGHLHALREQARTIPHPALAAAAAAHHAHLASLTTPTVHAYGYGEVEDGAHSGAAGGPELLTRQVLLVLREPGRQGGAQRLLRRLDDAAAFLAPLDIRLTALSTGHITALLAGHGNPDPSTRRQPPPDRPTANPHGGDARTSDDPAPRTSIEPRSARSARPPQPHQRQPHRSPVPAHRTINNGTGDYDDVQLEDMALADDRRPNPGQTSASEGELPQLPTERNRYLARHATSRQDAAGVEGGAVDFLLADDLTDDLVDNLIDDGGIESDLGSRSDLDRGSDLGGGAAGWWGR